MPCFFIGMFCAEGERGVFMNGKIAVVLNPQGEPSSLNEDCVVKIFTKQGDRWAAERQTAVQLATGDAPAVVRDKLKGLISVLGGCKVIAGSSISGLAYNILTRMGFYIFEINKVTEDVLDGIAEDVRTEGTPKEVPPVQPFPSETETAGVYWLDLIALQTVSPEISSKKALKPFFESTPFVCLELLCSHLPPWLENEQGLKIQAFAEEGRVRAVITRAC